jgi:hypothetical protein
MTYLYYRIANLRPTGGSATISSLHGYYRHPEAYICLYAHHQTLLIMNLNLSYFSVVGLSRKGALESASHSGKMPLIR